MGRRSRARTDHLEREDLGTESHAGSAFPLVVTGLSTAAALLLCVSGTIPTMQAERHLDEVETERARMHRELWAELDADVSHRMARQIDIQNLLVELDRRGVDTRSILFPEPVPEAGVGPDSRQNPSEPRIRDRR
jgi:hypothetical protein